MIRNRKSMLEDRIARLEKMLKNEGRPSARLSYLKDPVETWFYDMLYKGYFDDEDIRYLANGAPNGTPVEDCCDELGITDYHSPECDEVERILIKLAKEERRSRR